MILNFIEVILQKIQTLLMNHSQVKFLIIYNTFRNQKALVTKKDNSINIFKNLYQ